MLDIPTDGTRLTSTGPIRLPRAAGAREYSPADIPTRVEARKITAQGSRGNESPNSEGQ